MHLISLFFISRVDRVGNPFSHGRFLSPQVVKELSLVLYLLACEEPNRRAERKYEKERRRTAVVPFTDVNGVLQPYGTAVTLRNGSSKLLPYGIYILRTPSDQPCRGVPVCAP